MDNPQILVQVRKVVVGLRVGIVPQAEGMCVKPWRGGTGDLIKQYVVPRWGVRRKADGDMGALGCHSSECALDLMGSRGLQRHLSKAFPIFSSKAVTCSTLVLDYIP